MASSPQFFRIILQRNLEDQKLMIPKKFVRDYGKLLSSSVRLKVPDGAEWEVGLTTAKNGAVWLKNGWHRFAEHYCLEFGSLLVFRLDGDKSTFHITIFEATGVETEYCCNFNDSGGEFEEEDEDDDESDSSFEIFPRHSNKRDKASVPCFQPRKKMRNEGLFSPKMEPQEEEGCNNFKDMPSCKRMPEDEDGVSRRREQLAKKAEAAQKFSSKSEKPGFKVVMGKSNVDGRYNMSIPKKFAGKYLAEEFGTIRVQTSDSSRTWSLLYKWSRGKSAYISSGWKRFAEENLLKEGDIGFFQFIKKDQFLFTKQETYPSPSSSPSPSPKKKPATTRNPFFEVDIQFKTYKSAVLNIPMWFAKAHLSPQMHTAKLLVGNKEWKVKLKHYESCVRFSAGWSIFYGENWLEDRDTCLFEMVNRKKCVFKVTIFKHVTSSASMD